MEAIYAVSFAISKMAILKRWVPTSCGCLPCINPTGLWTGVEGGPPRYSSYHGYWPIEPRQLDERIGTAEDLDELVAEAHQRGIRILVDVVPNHIHQEHMSTEQNTQNGVLQSVCLWLSLNAHGGETSPPVGLPLTYPTWNGTRPVPQPIVPSMI